ncbi:MAG: peptidylprolyl isomerase [Cyanobacteria bacterium P01_H01_bin.121]
MDITAPVSYQDLLKQLKFNGQIPQLMLQILQRRMIAHVAQTHDLTVSDTELQEGADHFRLQHGLTTIQSIQKWLQQRQLTLDDFEEIVYEQLLTAKLATLLFGDRVEPYFYDNWHHYAQVELYEIVLADHDLALELFYALQEQELSFTEAARRYAETIELRRQAGYRGQLSRKDLPAELSAPVFAAQPAQLLKPIITTKGTHLLYVEEIIRPQLDEQLRLQILYQLFDHWLEEQLRKADLSSLLAA